MTDRNTQSKVQLEKVKSGSDYNIKVRFQPNNIACFVKENPIYKAIKKPFDDKEKNYITNVNT